MPIRYFTEVQKARRRGKRSPPVTAKQIESLASRMSEVFSFNFVKGVKRLRANVDTSEAEKFFRKRNYKGMIDSIQWHDLGDYLQPALDSLQSTIDKTASIAKKDLPRTIRRDLRLDTKNQAVSDYLNIRTGMLIQNVTEPAQVGVQAAIRRAVANGVPTRNVAAQVAKTLKATIGLNDQQQQQYVNFVGSDVDREALYNRLINYRAMMIARTEVSFAQNQGQLAVWKSAQDQGLIEDSATKVWIVDGAPCPKICDPMDNVEVPVGEDFELPDGVTVTGPPAHPHCRCLMSLNLGDNPDSGRQNYKDGADGPDRPRKPRGNDGEGNANDLDDEAFEDEG